jgi:SAM-dependent methyltransferase
LHPDPASLIDDFQAFERSLALRTAIELDLFTHIAAGKVTAGSLSAETKTSERGVQALCDFLTVRGHLQKKGARYSLTLNARLYLARDSPAYFGSAAKFLAGDATVKAFLQLGKAVKRGGASRQNIPGANGAHWVEFARSMSRLAEPVAEFAAAALSLDAARPLRVLDIAAGHGLYGLAIAAHYPRAQIFAMDSAPVLKVARANARERGLARHFHPLPGDALKARFGGPYDMVLTANFAHHLDVRNNVKLFKKSRAALRPGGCFVLLDFVPNEDRVSPSADAAFSLTLLATTASGNVYTFKEYGRMLRAAGFGRVRRLSNKGYGRWIIIAQ